MTDPFVKDFPIDIVGSTTFGRYPKISPAQTFNMYISDGMLVNYPGHKKVNTIADASKGRGMFNSIRYGLIVAVISEKVYVVNPGVDQAEIGQLDTYEGDVFIDENGADQIAICDKKNIYIFNHATNAFSKVNTDFTPSHVSFHNGYFVAGVLDKPEWRLSKVNDGLDWPADAQNVGEFETKPDNVLACVRVPSKENQILIFGNTVTESWQNVGGRLFPYQRSSAFNIDYGCANPATIAAGDTFVAWVGTNEKSSPVLLYTSGGEVRQISNDGINFKLSRLSKPERSYASLIKIDGHLFYQVTFYDDDDNLTLAYDFNTEKFYTLTDNLMNHHIAKYVTYYKNEYYFITNTDGNVYLMSSDLDSYDGREIPRIRVTSNFRLPDNSGFIADNLNFLVEQGDTCDAPDVDFSISNNGGASYGNALRFKLNKLGFRRNKFTARNLGYANEISFQLRFWGKNRFVVGNGTLGVYQ